MSDSINIKGTITHIGETKTFGQKGFTKRDLVIQTEEKFPQELLVEATKDKCAELDAMSKGQTISVACNLKGRRWEGPNGVKFFLSLEVWRIESVGAAVGQPSAGNVGGPGNDQSDIPFASCDVGHEPSPIARVLR